MREFATRLDSLSAEHLAITDRSNREAHSARSLVVPARLSHSGPLPADVYTPIPYIVPAQIFAAALAEVKGLDPDRPRGLSKVTQTL